MPLLNRLLFQVPFTQPVIHNLTCTHYLCFRTNRLHRCALTTKVVSLWLECLQLTTSEVSYSDHKISVILQPYLSVMKRWNCFCCSCDIANAAVRVGWIAMVRHRFAFLFLRMFFCPEGESNFLFSPWFNPVFPNELYCGTFLFSEKTDPRANQIKCVKT